jgi:hypothetical protein
MGDEIDNSLTIQWKKALDKHECILLLKKKSYKKNFPKI